VSTPFLLHGQIEEGDTGATKRLEDQIALLDSKIAALETQQGRAKQEAVIALLNVLASAMRQIATGQIDVSAPPQSGAPTDRLDKWESVKKRFGGKEAELIDVLLTCGPRTNTQLKSLMKLAYSTVAALTLKMSNLGFLTRIGDAWGLKEL
jgi:hypothetical protein